MIVSINVIWFVDLSGGSKPLLGDTLVIAGTIFFAMRNVGEVGNSVVSSGKLPFYQDRSHINYLAKMHQFKMAA